MDVYVFGVRASKKVFSLNIIREENLEEEMGSFALFLPAPFVFFFLFSAYLSEANSPFWKVKSTALKT